MAYSPSEKYPGAVDVDPDYQGGKFRDNNPSTTNNGSPLKAIDRNELLARDEAIMNDAGFEYSGVADTPQDSQLFKAYKASLGNGANLLSNHNFLIQTPDDSQPLPSATPTSYPPGHQIFSGVFANETTGITNLTYIDGCVSFSGGDLYFAVPNTGGIERLTEFAASVADFDGKPRTRGVSFALVGDEYRVTVGVDALEDASSALTPLGSVKFEQGSVATGHDVVESLTAQTVSGVTNLQAASITDAKTGNTQGGAGVITPSVIDAGPKVINTTSYYAVAANAKPVGGASYLADTLVNIRSYLNDPSWVPDGFGDHYMFGGAEYVLYYLLSDVNLTQYGFLLDGSDETSRFNALSIFGKPAQQANGNLGLKDASISTIDFEISSSSIITCLTPDGVGNSFDTVKITGDNARIVINGTLDCNDSGITAFNFSGNDPEFYVRNTIKCSIKTGSSTYTGVAVFTGNGAKFKGIGEQFERNGVPLATIPAAPRLFTVQGSADDYYCEYSIATDATDNFVVGASTGKGRCDLVYSTGCLDNSVYHLGGKLSLGSVYHINGDDEVVVTKGDLSCDTITVRGYALSVLGWEDASRVTVSKIDWDDEDKLSVGGSYSGNIFRQRPLNTTSGRVKIDHINARYTGNNLCSVGSGNGITERLNVNNMDVLFRADTNNPSLNKSSWMALNGVNAFAIKDWTVNIFDVNGTLTSSDRFEGSASTLTGPSTWDSIKIQTTNASGFGLHHFRFRNAAQSFFESYGAVWQASIPSIEESNFSASSGIDVAETYPTLGAWNAGKTLNRRNLNPTTPQASKAIQWQCVTSGTPGQWVEVTANVVNVP